MVIDQIPVSLNEDITVRLTGANRPSETNFNDKRGLLAWRNKLGAGAKHNINFGYAIEWPSEKNLVFTGRGH